MMAVEDVAYSATMAWIEDVVALHPELWRHSYEFATEKGYLWVLCWRGAPLSVAASSRPRSWPASGRRKSWGSGCMFA